MSLSIVHTRAALGVNAPPITVEVHISKGLPGLTMVGLPETCLLYTSPSPRDTR